MDKNIKKIISEAFNELYNEIINEANGRITSNEVSSIIDNAKRRGMGINYDFQSGDFESEKNFNKIIDALINDYLETGNQKSKSAIQAAFSPQSPKMKTLVGKKFYGNPELEDALSSAYEQVLINNFDNIINTYNKNSGTFSGLITSDMRNKVYNYIVKGFQGAGVGAGQEDIFSGQKGVKSMEAPVGDKGLTLGDKLGGELSLEPGASMGDDAFAKEKQIAKQREILDSAIELLYNTMTEPNEQGEGQGFKNAGKKKQYIALKSLIMGEPTDQILEDYPGLFTDIKDVSRQFGYAVSSPEAREVSGIISDIYGVDFNFANLGRVGSQIASQSPEWDIEAGSPVSGGSEVAPAKKIKKSRTPKMIDAWKGLQGVMSQIGLKDKDFQSIKLINNIVQKLREEGKDEIADQIIGATERYKNAEKEARESGEYGAKQVAIKEEEIDALMEMVLARLSK